MIIPAKISLYFARQFLLWFFIGFGVCALVIFLADLADLLRKSSNADIGFGLVLRIAFLRLPNLIQQIAPFAVLFGSVLCFTRLTRSRELVIARASGVSVWQFLSPSILLSVFLGIFMITVFNPVSAIMFSRSETLQNKYFENNMNIITVSKSGLWLRQYNPENKVETLITAASISPDSRNFRDLIIFEFSADNKFIRRLDAHDGKLLDNSWQLKDVIVNLPLTNPEKAASFSIPTNLTLAQIQDSFSAPETLSFWELPDFIRTLEASGFSALRHKLYFHSLLATPILLAAMVFIASIFSLRFSRRSRTGFLTSAAIFVGFVLYFLTKITASFGIAGNMPIIMAAWAPAIISIIVGAWFLLHLEDG